MHPSLFSPNIGRKHEGEGGSIMTGKVQGSPPMLLRPTEAARALGLHPQSKHGARRRRTGLIGREDRGRCPEHRKQYERAIYRERGSAADRGYGSRWLHFRQMVLRESPLCASCGKAAQEVHHLIPVSGSNDERFFDKTNVVSLCKPCHSAETMRMLNERRRT
jgi:5-methylcytosine-specific restriction enzyme A